jgi:hypothetical protein
VSRQREIQSALEAAIKIGAPLYNQGNLEACYRVYAAAALDVNRKIEHCAGPKRALLDGVARADTATGWSNKAWAMRDAFDGLLDVFERAAPSGNSDARSATTGTRHVPHHALTLLQGCTNEQLHYIGNAIAGAINIGAPLYNQGNIEACYRVYEGAILDISRNTTACIGPNQALNAGLQEAAQRTTYQGKAWALRDAFDGMMDVLVRQLQGK